MRVVRVVVAMRDHTAQVHVWGRSVAQRTRVAQRKAVGHAPEREEACAWAHTRCELLELPPRRLLDLVLTVRRKHRLEDLYHCAREISRMPLIGLRHTPCRTA